MKAHRLKSGNYRVRVYSGGQYVGSVTAPTPKEAMKQALMLEGKTKLHKTTLRELLYKYCEIKSNILSANTLKEYRSTIRTKLQSIMDVPVDDLTPVLIQRAVNEDKLHLSPKTIRNSFYLVASALKVYAPDIDVKNIDLGSKVKKDIYIPTEKDIKTLLSAVEGTELELPVRLAALHGLRRSEICGLTKKDVNLKDKSIHIRQVVIKGENNRSIVRNTPKTFTSNRILYLDDKTFSLIEKSFLSENTEQICNIDIDALYRRFKKALKENNIAHFRFHDLRHYCASVMLALGVPDKYAAEKLGHSTDSTTKRVYQHIMESKRKQIDDDIQDFIKRKIDGE